MLVSLYITLARRDATRYGKQCNNFEHIYILSDDQQRVPLYEKVSVGNKIMTKVDNGDRALAEDKETCLEKIGWYGGDKPKDLDRNKVAIKPGTNGVETIREQYRVKGTEHSKRKREPANMMLHPTHW